MPSTISELEVQHFQDGYFSYGFRGGHNLLAILHDHADMRMRLCDTERMYADSTSDVYDDRARCEVRPWEACGLR